jgi:circadian clock protein KaiC
MKRRKPTRSRTAPASLPKAPTGIAGIDVITEGGLPKGRPSLVCGGPGCGKTLLAMEFLVRGATEFNEPGVFMAFEENEADLRQNVASLGFDLAKLALQKKVVLDYVRVERSEIEETGAFDLEGLFIRLGHAIDSIHAKRVVLDTIESLFASLAKGEQIVAAPTLIKYLPLPLRRFIGDMSKTEKILLGLDLRPATAKE